MRRFKNWLSGDAGEIGSLFKLVVVMIPAFPVPMLFGIYAWMLSLLFYKTCRIGLIKSLPLTFHVNVLAIGIALAWGHSFNVKIFYVISIASVTTLIFTTMLTRLFYYYWIPVLLSPAIAVYTFFRFFGPQLLMSEVPFSTRNMWYGIAVALVSMAFASPIFLTLMFIGVALSSIFMFSLNALAHLSLVPLAITGFGFAYTAGVASMPSRRSLLWGLFGVAVVSVFLGAADGSMLNSMPEFSLYKVVLVTHFGCLLSVYGLRLYSRYCYFSNRLVPEDKLTDKISHWLRFRSGEARVGLPFTGEWKVSQSFEGAWTHRGVWKHALDFVVTDAHNKTFKGSGFELTDYYAFGKNVLAPTSGYVVAVFQDYPDNPVGMVQNKNNFGNYVIIRDSFGAHVLLGHLKKGSVTCALYQYVEINDVIGQCGNSGYSPEPHIHMHVQADAVVGSHTIPFHVVNYLCDSTFHFHGVPRSDSLVTNPPINAGLCRGLSFRVNESFDIVTTYKGQKKNTKIENHLDPYWGSMYFTDGHAKLFHHRDSLTFYFYRYEGRKEGPLFDLMTALPRVPLIYGVDCNFRDQAPVLQWRSMWQRLQGYFELIVAEKFSDMNQIFQMKRNANEIMGFTELGSQAEHTSCILDAVDGFVEFTIGDRKYEVRSQREHGLVFDTVNIDDGTSQGSHKRIV